MPERRTLVVVTLATTALLAVVAVSPFVLGGSDDCPPLGNGGAMELATTGETVSNVTDAYRLVRSTVGERAHGASVNRGHFFGEEQIHRHIGGVAHFHVAGNRSTDMSVIGWVVTENGTVYRVVQGAC